MEGIRVIANRLTPTFEIKDVPMIRFSYIESFSCGVMLMYNLEKFYSGQGKAKVIELFEFIQSKTKLRLDNGWNTNLIQFSINDRDEELVKLCEKYSCSSTGFYLNYNSNNNIAIFTIECGINK